MRNGQQMCTSSSPGLDSWHQKSVDTLSWVVIFAQAFVTSCVGSCAGLCPLQGAFYIPKTEAADSMTIAAFFEAILSMQSGS